TSSAVPATTSSSTTAAATSRWTAAPTSTTASPAAATSSSTANTDPTTHRNNRGRSSPELRLRRARPADSEVGDVAPGRPAVVGGGVEIEHLPRGPGGVD